MAATLDESSLTTPLINGPKRWRRDIPYVDQLTSFQQDYMVLRASFDPTPLDTPHPDEAGYYLVDESALRTLSGGVVEFTREYARLPDSHFYPDQYAWYVPGMGSEDPPGSVVGIDSVANSANISTVTTAAAHGASVDDQVQVRYTVQTPSGQVTRTVLRTVLTAPTSTTMTFDPPIYDVWPITWVSLQRINPGRDAEVIPVASDVQVDYFLPGVNVTTFDAIPLLVEYANIYDSTGRKTTSFTDSTSPTLSDYRAQIASATKIVVERSVLRRWKGNIFARSTRYAVAI